MAQITDLSSHCQTLAGTRYLILCCHDLNFVQTRTKAKEGGPRKTRADDMLRSFKNYRATTILQPAHETDTERTWLLPWIKLSTLITFDTYATGIKYPPRGARKPLTDVLEKTKGGLVTDYLWTGSGAVRKLSGDAI
jgi:hypothetical protein